MALHNSLSSMLRGSGDIINVEDHRQLKAFPTGFLRVRQTEVSKVHQRAATTVLQKEYWRAQRKARYLGANSHHRKHFRAFWLPLMEHPMESMMELPTGFLKVRRTVVTMAVTTVLQREETKVLLKEYWRARRRARYLGASLSRSKNRLQGLWIPSTSYLNSRRQ